MSQLKAASTFVGRTEKRAATEEEEKYTDGQIPRHLPYSLSQADYSAHRGGRLPKAAPLSSMVIWLQSHQSAL